MYTQNDFFNIVELFHLLAAWKCYLLDVGSEQENSIFSSVSRGRNQYIWFRKKKNQRKKKKELFLKENVLCYSQNLF